MTYTELRYKGKGSRTRILRLRALLVRVWLRLFGPRWTVGVLAIMRDARGRVCLLKHKGRLRPWGLPGGLVAWPEAPEKALIRELQEELGWEDVARRSFVLQHTLQSDKFPLLELIFETEGTINALDTDHWTIQESEIEEVSWFSFEEVAKLEGILERHRALLTGVLRHS